MNGARRWPETSAPAPVYVPTDCMDEDAIPNAVKTAARLGPLRAVVITHIGALKTAQDPRSDSSRSVPRERLVPCSSPLARPAASPSSTAGE
jgi:hypothetical protein